MINAVIMTIPQDQQRYDTLGDWQLHKTGVTVQVSDVGNPDYEFAVAIHELVEAYLCKKKGITTKQVDDFDMAYKGDGEPGDDKDCPYYHEHQTASAVEHIIINAMGIAWTQYNKDLGGI